MAKVMGKPKSKHMAGASDSENQLLDDINQTNFSSMTAAVLLEGEQQSNSDEAAPHKEEQLHKSDVQGTSPETPISQAPLLP
jgi:hypothetical protein